MRVTAMNGQQLINRILMVSVFVLVFCTWSTCVILWVIQYIKQQRRVRQRLGIGDAETQKAQALQLWREGRRTGGRREYSERDSLAARLERLRTQAGWKTPVPAVFLMVMAVAALALTVALILGGGVWLGLGAAVIVVAGFWALTERRIAMRIALFERQFVDSLGIAARALRAGHPLVGAFQLITEEVDDPVGSLFGEICQEQALGLDLQDSLQRVANASHNVDLKLFATAVRIQMSSGGNLAELMDTLATVMRSRMRLHRRVRVLTAQTQMSKRILIGLPILLFLMLNVVAPMYMQSFYKTWTGRYMLAATVTGVLLGMWLMRRLSVLRY
jgi:tight adherence protein B